MQFWTLQEIFRYLLPCWKHTITVLKYGQQYLCYPVPENICFTTHLLRTIFLCSFVYKNLFNGCIFWKIWSHFLLPVSADLTKVCIKSVSNTSFCFFMCPSQVLVSLIKKNKLLNEFQSYPESCMFASNFLPQYFWFHLLVVFLIYLQFLDTRISFYFTIKSFFSLQISSVLV